MTAVSESDVPHRFIQPPTGGAVILLVVFLLLAIGANTAFTLWSVSRSQNRWCSTLTLLDNSYRRHPATTTSGKKFYYDLHKLAVQYGCER